MVEAVAVRKFSVFAAQNGSTSVNHVGCKGELLAVEPQGMAVVVNLELIRVALVLKSVSSLLHTCVRVVIESPVLSVVKNVIHVVVGIPTVSVDQCLDMSHV